MSEPSLNISVEHLKRVDLFTVEGRVDSSNSAELDQALKDSISEGHHNLVVNLSNVSYMSSAGLRALVSALRACKKKNGDLRISAPSERVSEVFQLAGLTSSESPLFTVYDDDTIAVGSF